MKPLISHHLNKWVKSYLDKLGLKGGKTATGQYSTSESILEKNRTSLAEVILEHRGLAKVKQHTDRSRAIMTQRIVAYQLSPSTHGNRSVYLLTDPNLQNIPIRTRQLVVKFVKPLLHLKVVCTCSRLFAN